MVHGDVKPANLLLPRKGAGAAALTDFGLSRARSAAYRDGRDGLLHELPAPGLGPQPQPPPPSEPTALERERLMGYPDNFSASALTTEPRRRVLLGQAFDMHALRALFAAAAAAAAERRAA